MHLISYPAGLEEAAVSSTTCDAGDFFLLLLIILSVRNFYGLQN